MRLTSRLVALVGVAALLAFAAPAHAQEESTSAVTSKTGFDALADLVQQLHENIRKTHLVTEAKYLRDQQRCNATLGPVQAEIDSRTAQIAKANADIGNGTQEIESLFRSLEPVNKATAEQQVQLDAVNGKLKDTTKLRDDEQALYQQKITDTAAVVDAVALMLDRLVQVNVSDFRFQQELEQVKKSINDPQLSSLVESAITAVSKVQAEIAQQKEIERPSAETTLSKLRLLMNLLVVELRQYKEELVRQKAVSLNDWNGALKEQLDVQKGIMGNLTALGNKKNEIHSNIEATKKKVDDAKKFLAGAVPVELKVWLEKKTSITKRCDLKRKQFDLEVQARNSQHGTLQAILKLVDDQPRNGEDLGLRGIAVPTPATCCKVCDNGAVPCGDACISKAQADTLKAQCARGCACTNDDPRLAAMTVAPKFF